MGRDDNDRRFGVFCGDTLQKPQAVESGHLQIRNQNIKAFFFELGQRVQAIHGFGDRIPFFLQHRMKDDTHVQLVVDN
ncbi:MAG: hypothetical protein A4E72_00871 [Syntrophus sp. PtaU1.Bin208]|nr:MAG: hypothetical protein A4E72_00871 [Syntrophus sp. PtaU1.Bin208]